jgi:cell division protease FtsH
VCLPHFLGQFNVTSESNDISYSQFIQNVKQGNVSSVTIAGSNISGVTALGEKFETYSPGDLGLMGDLLNNGVSVQATPPAKESFVKQLIISLAPILLLIGVIMYTMRGAGGAMGGKNPMSFGKSKARLITKDESHVTFEDVAGVEEAKEEVGELVDFLSDPSKFTKVGGKIPKGVLMVGPPGTGKTLLAKAVAGEADVPFFFISGSDFVEMFVGVGASRVRDMFDQAKKNAPCIIFIDEIDAVGRQRGAGMGGGHDEREQTLNQMLVEMDGFEGSEGIIVVAATNRPDVLDPALLRPGRFDRTVTVGLPDINGRDAILKVHMRKLPIAKNVKSMDIARGTPGFSGADLANLTNEAALIAARFSKKLVGMRELEKAKDKIMMGAERKGMVMDAAEKEMTAYHEAGHAIVGRLMPEHDPVYKVSIIPRGRALGVTMFLPEKDSYSISKRKLNSQVASLFGGRIAEELVYGEDAVTTGASNDIERATEIQAKKNAPCIIFIDEIDAVGRQRGAGMGGGHDEREQTLNQMLVEMDGFEGSEGIIVVAATNRPDVLDPALLRPGRFDRTVTVGLPDINGRDAILKVHMRKLPIAKNVKSMDIARGTPGFSGADLANLANEAALIAARFSKKLVGMREFEKAKDKIMMGAERKGMVMDASEKEMTAYHEAGHAIVGRLMPEHDPVYKVSIIPRGRALGVTMFLPEKDSYSISKRKLNSQVASLFGGRIAEELVYGEDAVTTGASNDIERATEIAHKMVKLWGMSSVMGPMAYGEDEGEVFLGRQVTKHKHISDETFTKVDSEIRKIIDTNYSAAYKIIKDNRDILDAMAAALVEFETIDTNQIDDLMARIPMREAAEVIDSDEVSSELGTGGKDSKSSKSSTDTKTDADGGGTEQFA